MTSTKHSARTPDSTRKSVSAVGLSKLQSSDPEIDDNESAVGDLDSVSGSARRHKHRSNSNGGADSHSTTSSSSGGLSLSLSQQNASVSQ